jgi:putative Mg2+ transporter-C (MgtC) family protein
MIISQVVIKILVAIILGAFIGYERETQHKSVGIRDVMLLTLAATLFTILAFEIPKHTILLNVDYDIGRIIAYTIAGIGFLGSGVIIQTKDRIEGITTATLLFTVLAVGFFCGLGLYQLAVLSAGCIWVILRIKYIKIITKKKRKRRQRNVFKR